jgi:histidinol-phosphate/aromatic aminotransferase/cobyric acid decarboxylase-like protein
LRGIDRAAAPVFAAGMADAPHTFDLDAMLAAVTDRTRLIFVCNPNNPTSTVVDPDELARFVAAVP